MRQTLHIFGKDVRYLWREICLVLALDAMFAWIETHSPDPWWAEMLLTAAAGYLVARLIHAEAIPGASSGLRGHVAGRAYSEPSSSSFSCS